MVIGFRAISEEGAKRTGKTGKGRDVTCHVAWEKRSTVQYCLGCVSALLVGSLHAGHHRAGLA